MISRGENFGYAATIENTGAFHWGVKDPEEEKAYEADGNQKKIIKVRTQHLKSDANRTPTMNLEAPYEESKSPVSDVREAKTVSDFVALKNLDLKISKGSFVCVIGDVGSGKSSLLSALIGDLLLLSG